MCHSLLDSLIVEKTKRLVMKRAAKLNVFNRMTNYKSRQNVPRQLKNVNRMHVPYMHLSEILSSSRVPEKKTLIHDA